MTRASSFVAALDRWVHRQSAPTMLVVVAALVLAIGIADYWTGPLVSFSIFYLIPVVLASWHGNRHVTIFACLSSAATWLLVDVSSIDYSRWLIPAWNASVRLGFFSITAALVWRLNTVVKTQTALADIDGLTGALNRRAFERRAGFVLQLAERHEHTLAVAYLDIDNFKAINDTLGHHAGDEVLCTVHRLIRDRLRETDLVSRLGGDEFAILLPETDRDGAEKLMRDIQQNLQQVASHRGWAIGLSTGLLVCRPPMPTLAQAMKQADKLMYRSKKQGEQQVVVERYSA